MRAIRRCRDSSAGNCGEDIAVMLRHSIGWAPFAMPRKGMHGNGSVAKMLRCHSGICPVAMRTVLDMMDQRDGFGAIPIVIHS